MRAETIHKVEVLDQTVDTILRDVKDKSFEEFEKDDVLVRATAFSMFVVARILMDLEEALGNLYLDIPWNNVKDTKAFILRDYGVVHSRALYNTVTNDLPRLKHIISMIKVSL